MRVSASLATTTRSSSTVRTGMGEFGSSDEELFKRGVTILRGLEAQARPSTPSSITLSSHGPSTPFPHLACLSRSQGAVRSLVGDYISEESYSDMAIGKFIKSLQATGLWDNSVVVIYGDQHRHARQHVDRQERTRRPEAPRPRVRPRGSPADPPDHPPAGPDDAGLRTDVAGQVDIMPTVADLVGADLTQVPHVGRSLFVDSSALVPLMPTCREGAS